MAIADWVEARVDARHARSTSISPAARNSCAQHYIGDIGLHCLSRAGRRRRRGHGGRLPRACRRRLRRGRGDRRELYRDVKVEDCPRLIERILKAYLPTAPNAEETFLTFTRRMMSAALKAMVDAVEERRMSVQDEGAAAADAMIPEWAPFSPEQRAWLNGFFAGLLSLDAKAGVTPLDGAMPDAAAKALGRRGDGAPWHDAAMPIAERMTAGRGQAAAAQAVRRHGAAGLRPVRLPVRDLLGGHRAGARSQAQPVRARRQGDEPHAQASPGGDAGAVAGNASPREAKPAEGAARLPSPASRDAPVEAMFRSATRLNGGNRRRTRATSCSTSPAAGLDYTPGDSFGLYPTNDPALADAVLAALRAPAGFPHRRQDASARR